MDVKRYNKPVYIFENGLADAKDEKREKFIIDHLKWIHTAIEDGVDVRGYFYWSLLDNFEWDKGFAPRFGLIEIDRENNLKRIPRPSSEIYSEICKNNAINI
jgi:beta-glucosidase